MNTEYLNNEPWENLWKVENEVWFCRNISRKNFVVKFILKALLKEHSRGILSYFGLVQNYL